MGLYCLSGPLSSQEAGRRLASAAQELASGGPLTNDPTICAIVQVGDRLQLRFCGMGNRTLRLRDEPRHAGLEASTKAGAGAGQSMWVSLDRVAARGDVVSGYLPRAAGAVHTVRYAWANSPCSGVEQCFLSAVGARDVVPVRPFCMHMDPLRPYRTACSSRTVGGIA